MAEETIRHMHTCVFHVMRHGEKDGDTLTEFGKQQVAASAEKWLQKIPIMAAYHSGMNRAEQTTRIVLETLGIPVQETPGGRGAPVREERGFGFKWLLEDPCFPPFDFPALEAEIDGNGLQPVNVWLRRSAHVRALRERYLATMLHIAREARLTEFEASLSRNRPARALETHILVGSHSPFGELLVLGGARLGFADTIKYTVESGPFGTTLAECAFYPCPLVKE